jgi:hypothetical protein
MQSAQALTLVRRAAAPAARAVFTPAPKSLARAVSFAAARPAAVQFAAPAACRAMATNGFLDAKEVRALATQF